MAYQVIDANDVEASHGVFRGLTAPLGVSAFKVNRLELQADGEGPEHDHEDNNEQEVYAIVAGSGTLRVDGQKVALRPGLFVYCSPEARRQMSAGPEGLTWIGIGATGGIG
jgi:quercetin dioxygenase-like cupin family protein